MKIPNIFIPEKNLEGQTENLLKPPKKKEIERLTDFAIYEDKGLKTSRFGTYKGDFSPFLNQVVVDGIWIEYGLPVVEILEFRNAHTLKINTGSMLLENKLKFSDVTPYYVITKNVYAGFIHAENKNRAEEIVENYREKFGFEAHEIISGRK